MRSIESLYKGSNRGTRGVEGLTVRGVLRPESIIVKNGAVGKFELLELL